MLTPTPATNCCGCLVLRTGVKLILLLNLIQNVYTCAMAVGHVILQLPTYGYATSVAMQIYMAAWCLAGIPIILIGLWGVFHHLAVMIWPYFYYMIVSFLIDLFFLVRIFVLKDVCAKLTVAQYSDKAFACGCARMLSRAWVLVLTGVMLYFIYIVWSYCYDLSYGGTEGAITRLLVYDKQQEERERLAKRRYWQQTHATSWDGWDDDMETPYDDAHYQQRTSLSKGRRLMVNY